MHIFLDWLAKLKAVIGFLRDVNNMGVLVKHFKDNGMQGLSEMMKNLSLPNFANWRWGTLRACCKQLGTVLDTVTERFAPTLFQGSRDQAQLQKVIVAFFQHCGTTYSNLFLGSQNGLENYWNEMQAVIAMSKNSEMARKSVARGKDDGWPQLMSSVSWL